MYKVKGDTVYFTQTLEICGTMIKLENLCHPLTTSKHPKIPDVFYEILKSKACRYAIKFGDKLSFPEMEILKKAI